MSEPKKPDELETIPASAIYEEEPSHLKRVLGTSPVEQLMEDFKARNGIE